jgi:hypothetical protein
MLPTGDGEMKTNGLGSVIEQSHAALDAIQKGDPSVYQALYSDAEDVTLGNPFGPYARGPDYDDTAGSVCCQQIARCWRAGCLHTQAAKKWEL